MTSITVAAPAKVNLFLKVLSRRKDSYHNILTLFERINLADTIKISKINNGIIVKSDIPITRKAEDNLVYKAAEAILKYCSVKQGVKIQIEKRIPIAAGLGGGSSDAASVLIGINRLFRLKLNNKTLVRIGKKLGADVPFFVLNTSFAVGKGRGDELIRVNSRSRLWHVLINPPFRVAARDVYRVFDSRDFVLTHRRADAKITPLPHNDLEKAVILKKKVIGKILEGLAQLLNKKAIVSGSGPSLFCLYGSRKEAIRAKKIIERGIPAGGRRGWRIFVVSTC